MVVLLISLTIAMATQIIDYFCLDNSYVGNDHALNFSNSQQSEGASGKLFKIILLFFTSLFYAFSLFEAIEIAKP